MENIIIMKNYTLFWLTGEVELVKGNTIAEALTLAGYSNGALRALDFYSEGDVQNDWKWDATNRSWNQK